MSFIIALVLAGKLLTVTPSSVAPDTIGLSGLYFSNSALVYGHNYLSGGEFYSLRVGDNVPVYFADGSTRIYRVSFTEAYTAQSTTMASTGEDFPLRVGNEWRTVTQVIDGLSFDGVIVMITCYPRTGQVTGRLFIQLIEVR